jgi:hypothetical protein
MKQVFTVSGNKAGEQIIFTAQFEKSNFLTVIDAISTFYTIQDVKEAEAKGIFKLV